MPSKKRTLHLAIRAWLLLILLQLGVSSGLAQEKGQAGIQEFAFNKMALSQVFHIYQAWSGVQLVITPPAQSQSSRNISVISNTPLTNAEACKLIENALREQAGILITKIDDKGSSVTYDATLPIKIVTLPKPSTNSIASGAKNSTNAPSRYVPPPPPSTPPVKKSN